VHRNRSTVIFGVTPAQMTENTDVADWETGFFSRFLLFMDTKGYRPIPARMSPAECEQIEGFAVAMGQQAYKESQRAVHVTPTDGRPTAWKHFSMTIPESPEAFHNKAAWRTYEELKGWIRDETKASSRYARGPIQRSLTKLMRLAALYEWQHPMRPKLDQWRFHRDSLESSQRVIAWHIQATRVLAEIVAADPFNRLCLEILDRMASRPDYGWSADEIHAGLPQRQTMKHVLEALAALVSRAEIRSSQEYGVKGSGQVPLYMLPKKRKVLNLR
jgi:hypothetical protein